MAEPLELNRPGLGVWVLAARPRTLTAAVTPVVVGTAVAASQGSVRPVPALAALPLAIPPLRLVLRQASGALNPALGGTARLQIAYGALLAIGLWR